VCDRFILSFSKDAGAGAAEVEIAAKGVARRACDWEGGEAPEKLKTAGEIAPPPRIHSLQLALAEWFNSRKFSFSAPLVPGFAFLLDTALGKSDDDNSFDK
jgi:hypothetical protein